MLWLPTRSLPPLMPLPPRDMSRVPAPGPPPAPARPPASRVPALAAPPPAARLPADGCPPAFDWRLCSESPRALPPYLLAVALSAYGVPPRCAELCDHFWPPPAPPALLFAPAPPRLPPPAPLRSDVPALAPPRLPSPRFPPWPRSPPPVLISFLLKLLLTLMSTSPPCQPQPQQEP